MFLFSLSFYEFRSQKSFSYIKVQLLFDLLNHFGRDFDLEMHCFELEPVPDFRRQTLI